MPQDPYYGFRFVIEFQGITQAGFMECSALSSHLEVIEYREGGDPINVHKLPGKASYPDITLKWGMTDNQDLYKWHLQAVQGNIKRVSGSIVQLDATGNEKTRFNFYNAWPSKWDGPAYNAKGNELSITSLTLSFDRWEMA